MPYPRFQGLINRLLRDSADHPDDGHQLVHLVQGKVITGVEYSSASRHFAQYAPTPMQSLLLGDIQFWLREGDTEAERVLLLHGPVGVGKTLVMQNFTEIEAGAPSPALRATLFLSHQEQLFHVLITIAYQLSSQSKEYQRYLVELLRFVDPNLMEASLDKQFEKLLVKPFDQFGKTIFRNHEDTNLIVIDGLDRCKGNIEHFFRLIADFTYNNSNPTLVWLISSRSKFPASVGVRYRELELPRDQTVELLRRNQKLLALSFPEQLATRLTPKIDFDLLHLPPPPRLTAAQTRILHNILSWVNDPTHAMGHVLWLLGYAGVGKSTVMRSLASEEPKSLGAKIFFSGLTAPDDSRCVFTTIAYQLSMKYEPYREYAVDLLERDLTILEGSIEHQFDSFIRRPLGEENLLRVFGTILIILDGLDQLTDTLSKQSLVRLICRFSREYPTASPIWILTSSPERYIRDALSDSGKVTHWEMEIGLDVKGVKEYLRAELQDLGNHRQQWPTKADFTKITQCASGLFITAVMLIHCIRNLCHGDPESSLQETLGLISKATSREDGKDPFLVLTALYDCIYAEIAQHHPSGTQRLLTLLFPEMVSADFVLACNWAGIPQDASQMFYLVLDIPASAEEASRQPLRAIHSSFVGYLSNRSYFLAEKRNAFERNISILKQAHNPDERVVQSSRLQPLPWPHKDRQNIQDELFEWSLTWLLNAEPEAMTSLSELGTFFQDLDYRKNVKIFGRPGNLVRGHIFHENHLQFVRAWGVQSEIFPVSDLEQNRFCWNEEACVLTVARGSYHPHKKEVGSQSTWAACFSTSGRKGFHRGVLGEELRLRVVHHISTPANLNTSSARFIGRGDRACVFMQIIGVMDMEAYLIPYDRPASGYIQGYRNGLLDGVLESK